MKWITYIILLISLCTTPVHAVSLDPPAPPEDALQSMPVTQKSFAEDLWYVLRSALDDVSPHFAQGVKLCMSVMAVAMLTSVVNVFPAQNHSVTELCGGLVIATAFLSQAGAMIRMASDTVTELSNYAKLLLPVIASAMVAQGGTTSSATLYTGTAIFNGILCGLIRSVMIPMVYIFIVLAFGKCCIGDGVLDKLQNSAKWLVTWCLKIILYVFTGYMTITGVVSGATDQIALKATKLTISGMVPVVGNILSDASEAVLVSATTAKNVVGVYGAVAIIAITAAPFLRIGIHHLLLKTTAGICGIFGSKRIVGAIHDLSTAMGLLLAMTGTECLLLLISVICFMKGVG